MSSLIFRGALLVVEPRFRNELKAVLPGSLGDDLDTRERNFDGKTPAFLGDRQNLEEGLCWGAVYEPTAITVQAVAPDLTMTLAQLQEFEGRRRLHLHPAVLFMPLCQLDDGATHALVETNLYMGRPWHEGLA